MKYRVKPKPFCVEATPTATGGIVVLKSSEPSFFIRNDATDETEWHVSKADFDTMFEPVPDEPKKEEKLTECGVCKWAHNAVGVLSIEFGTCTCPDVVVFAPWTALTIKASDAQVRCREVNTDGHCPHFKQRKENPE